MNLFYRTTEQLLADFEGPLTEQIKLLNLIYSTARDIDAVREVAESGLSLDDLKAQTMTKAYIDELIPPGTLPPGSRFASGFQMEADGAQVTAVQINSALSGSEVPSGLSLALYSSPGYLVVETHSPVNPSTYRSKYAVSYGAMVVQAHTRIGLRMEELPAAERVGTFTNTSPTAIPTAGYREVQDKNAAPAEDKLAVYKANGRLNVGDADFASPTDAVNVKTLADVVPSTVIIGGNPIPVGYVPVVAGATDPIDEGLDCVLIYTQIGGVAVGYGVKAIGKPDVDTPPISGELYALNSTGNFAVRDTPQTANNYSAVNMRTLNQRFSHAQRLAIDALDPATATIADIVNALQAS